MKRRKLKYSLFYKKFPDSRCLERPDLLLDYQPAFPIISYGTKNDVYTELYNLEQDTRFAIQNDIRHTRLRTGDIIFDNQDKQYYSLSESGHWVIVNPLTTP